MCKKVPVNNKFISRSRHCSECHKKYCHDIYMKISMAVVSAVFSLFGVKIFNGGD